jgi:transcriptional regulator with XRE-family HTH domain
MTQNAITRKRDTSLGERIKAARNEASLSTAKLARELDVDTRTVARWQADDSTPSVVRLMQIAEVLGKPASFFLDGEEVAA